MSECSIDLCESPAIARGWCAKHYQRWKHHGSPTTIKNKYPQRGALSAFIEESLLRETDECIEWPFGRARNYAYCDGKLVSHTVCEKAHGPRPSADHEVAHSCRNPPCINKRHLRWATHAENEEDKKAHGTYQYGENNPGAKLTEGDVHNIRKVLAAGEMSCHALGQVFGVSHTLISQIKRRKIWTHIT